MNVVVLAASLGGVEAVGDVLSGLPADFPAALLVVQHRAVAPSGLLDEILARQTPLRVKPGGDGEPIRTGTVYVAPGGYHLLLDPDGLLRLSQSEKVRYVRPAADVLFKSVADNHKGRIVAVDGTVRRARFSANKEASQMMLAALLKQIDAERAGCHDPAAGSRSRLVGELLAEYRQHHIDRGNTAKQADQAVSRCRRVFDGCRFAVTGDLDGTAAGR